ncbi:MAG: hypothetical protein EOQ86_07890 [Mesorhizobium sp.]|uniref:hypothetical protein n=1 Tax=Mesorhizobium sp. TaxID=1871066 RepID=UPI000FE9BE2A|nr:hypothetical protein [Mesorhizobium sp.]RWH81925.1 MAG: hypothetical protein EOQ85_06275 [Mesorhizobium sp.]RWH84923.1 MAG: hypothetical protein EOQ86_07890 [Mesorhizobium sp.]RWH89680.1 MAG: hypothetical protein EOQ87_13955 [Mesorhizobium sp.]RWH98572.1 MAG: hypothetical protein EOQ88_15225 [Mesorhizobium sp.]RWI04424.1 MAG: hypothetical protein EOQ89_07335 [Mesorhizobium sp.]
MAGADIGLREGKLNRKSEPLDMKSDTECDKFGHLEKFMVTYKALARTVGCYAACSYAPCSGDMAPKKHLIANKKACRT